jgi:hypothetical protein
MIQTEQIPGPSAWRAEGMTKRDFCLALPPDILARIDARLDALATKDVLDITAEDFADDAIAAFMRGVRTELREGHGLVILTGCEGYDDDALTKIFWSLGTHIGVAETQSIFGDRIGHVQKTHVNPTDRGYRSDRELQLHCDSTDVAGLLCLRPALSGGISQFTSALAIHNEMLRACPDLLPPLYEGYPYHRAGEQLPHEPPITPYNVPVFAWRDGLVSCHYLRAFIDMAARELSPAGLPEPLRTALATFDAIATRPDIMIEFHAARGDMAFMNNHMILHARSAFRDDPDPALARHLLRLWLEVEDLRPIAPAMDVHGKGGIKAQPALVPMLISELERVG